MTFCDTWHCIIWVSRSPEVTDLGWPHTYWRPKIFIRRVDRTASVPGSWKSALKSVLHASPVISPAQHGFLPRRSCTTNLTCLVKQLWDSIADGLQTDVTYTDHSSAFTSVNHSLLLHKLHHSYHLSGTALRWIESYLCGREQCVVLNGKASGWVPVGSGVPEGSICGPILFVLFCNDAPSCISSTCLMYADDMMLARRIRSPDDAVALQTDLDIISAWSTVWKLKLNPAKCKVITFTLRKNEKTCHDVILHQ